MSIDEDDFYTHVNHQWMQTVRIPKHRSSINMYSQLEDRHIAHCISRMKPLLSDPYVHHDDFHLSLSQNTWIHVLTYLNRLQISPLSVEVEISYPDADQFSLVFSNHGYHLPCRESYLSKKTQQIFCDTVHQCLPCSVSESQDVWYIESQLARIATTPLYDNQLEKTRHYLPLSEIQHRLSWIDWYDLLHVMGFKRITPSTKIRIPSMKSMEKLQELMLYQSTWEQWAVYFRWCECLFWHEYVFLSPIKERALFRLEQHVWGTRGAESRLRQCFHKMQNLNAIPISRIFQTQVWQYRDKQDLVRIYLHNLQKELCEVFVDLLDTRLFQWMHDTKTIQHAIRKIREMTIRFFGPSSSDEEETETYPPSPLTMKQKVQAHYDRYMGYWNDATLVSRTPYDWSNVSSVHVNAYYDAQRNEMVIPAGILEPPFFSLETRSNIYNYARIGTIIGHEMVHAIDDYGRRFDVKGNQRDWWSVEDDRLYRTQKKSVIRHYASLGMNGALTFDENFADIVGCRLAYEAYCRKFSVTSNHRQIFFYHYAKMERGKRNIQNERLHRRTDVHSTEKFRVNGVIGFLTS